MKRRRIKHIIGTTAAAILLLSGVAEADGPDLARFVCTPMSLPNSKAGPDPIVRVNVGLWKSGGLGALHIHFNGKTEDRALQFNNVVSKDLDKIVGRYWIGSRGDHIIGGRLHQDPDNKKIWYYTEWYSTTNDKNLLADKNVTTAARCFMEWPDGGTPW